MTMVFKKIWQKKSHNYALDGGDENAVNHNFLIKKYKNNNPRDDEREM